jgi:hypothetical protein
MPRQIFLELLTFCVDSCKIREQSRNMLIRFLLFFFMISVAEAKITRIDITKTEPAFAGRVFGNVGAYVRLSGKAYGEVSPFHAGNKIIQDIALAPRNARGMVEYVTDIDILRPADLAKGNKTFLFEIHNRGRKLLQGNMLLDLKGDQTARNNLTDAGDGYLMNEGYTFVWYGWQADVLAGDGRLTLSVPIAKNKDGSPIIETIRTEITTLTEKTVMPLAGGWWTATDHKSYPTSSSEGVLTVRDKEQAVHTIIPASDWSFGDCTKTNETQICLKNGFKPSKIYELTYKAKDPTVNGLGFAATRDLAAFLKNEKAGNPVYMPKAKAIVIATSQSGRMLRTFIHLGFNRDEAGRVAYEGAYPHIGGGMISMNIRFSQLGRAWGDQVDHLYPAYDFPFNYAKTHDPLTGRTQGVLDRCKQSNTCPKIFHVATALEVWEGRQSLGLTDPLGTRDVKDPANVRTFIFASTQHGSAAYSPSAPIAFGQCQQQLNPNPQIHTHRALITALKEWVNDGREPPASAVPSIASGTLVHPNNVTFPTIPANTYGNVKRIAFNDTRTHNPLTVLDFGARYNPADSSGILQEPPKKGTAAYGILVPQTDKDGNDLGGLRTLQIQVPIGTYTGRNLFKEDRFGGGFCSLSGSFIPFAKSREERVTAGDPRLSIEERYPNKEAYVSAVKLAASNLVKQRYLLQADADILVKEAEGAGVRLGP